MSGPHVLLRLPDGRPLLAFGSSAIMWRATELGFRAHFLTAHGLEDPGHRLEREQPALRVHRCGFLDNADLDQARAVLDRCGPAAVRLVRAGVPVLVTDAAGENRTALLPAYVARHVTGQSGADIYRAIKAVHPSAFSNRVFGRYVRSWPAIETRGIGLPIGTVVGAILAFAVGAWTARASRASRRSS